jgi:hypothetical protein
MVKGTVIRVHTMTRYVVVELWLHTFLTSALYEGVSCTIGTEFLSWR